MTIAARPTIYRGVQMRSRLEATFAGFLDQGAYGWAYEPFAYADGHDQWLPDFRVNDLFDGSPVWIEVRGRWSEGDEEPLKRMAAIRASDPQATLLFLPHTVEWADGGEGRPQCYAGLLDVVGAEPWRAGFFGLCECGIVSFGGIRRRSRTFFVCDRCRRESLVGYVDPFKWRKSR